MLRHALRSDGPWQRVVRGVYATFSGPLNELHRMRAAVLYGGPGAMITGAVACRARGLRYGPADDGFVDVPVDEGRYVRDAAFIRIHRTNRLPDPTWWRAAVPTPARLRAAPAGPTEPLPPDIEARPGLIPLVPAARTALDTVRAMRSTSQPAHQLQDTRALLSEFVQRRRCSVDALAVELARAPRRGSGIARRVLDDLVAGCRSAPECELRDLVRSSPILPEPRWNLPLPGYPSTIPDACWPEARLAVEVDSREWHAYDNAPARTEERHALYARLG